MAAIRMSTQFLRLWGLTWGFEEFAKFATECGYDGLEIMPQRFVLGAQMSKGAISQRQAQIAHVLVQSHRSEAFEVRHPWRYARKVLAHKSPAKVVVESVRLPERLGSLDILLDFMAVYGDRPAVMYPPHSWLGEDVDERFWQFPDRVVRTAPELLTHWNVTNVSGFAREAISRGWTGIAVNTAHWMRDPDKSQVGSDQRWFGDWRTGLPVLAKTGMITEIQVQPPDADQYFDVVDPNGMKSPFFQMLSTLALLKLDVPITIELDSKIAIAAMPEKIGLDAIKDAHTEFRGFIETLFS